MALTSGFPPQTQNRKNKFQCPRLGLCWGFQHPDRQMPGQLQKADGSFDSRISQFLVTPSLGQPVSAHLAANGQESSLPAGSHCWDAIQKSSQPFQNLCKAHWPGKPLARPPREGNPLGPACRVQWDHTEEWYSRRLYLALYQGIRMPCDESFS